LRAIPEMMRQITEGMKKLDPLKAAISEEYTFLRAIEFVVNWGMDSKKEVNTKKSNSPN